MRIDGFAAGPTPYFQSPVLLPFQLQDPTPCSGAGAEAHMCSVPCNLIYLFFSFLVYTIPLFSLYLELHTCS
jgi:hypothetical protein